MKRRSFLKTTLVTGVTPLLANLAAGAEKAKPDESGTVWHNPEEWGVEGRCWPEQKRSRYYDRLPASAEGKVTGPVWGLSRHSAGMAVRFKTDSRFIKARYKLLTGSLAMPHMPATGVSGVDLYAKDSTGKWRWVAVTKPTAQEISAVLIDKLEKQPREWMLYLPLYNGLETLEIGVEDGASFDGIAPREEGLIAFYGTSITHGACASRPGMAHVAMLGRRLDVPTLNLGFSGNGRMDLEVGEFFRQLDAAVLVIDCVPNMSPEEVTRKTVPLVNQIRESRPTTPILLVESRRNTESWISPTLKELHDSKHKALKTEFAKLQAAGVKHLFYLGGDGLLGDDADGATDGSHPSDLGFHRQADAFEPVLRKILGR
jgi:lysophospholipase L1-like esterase